MGKLPKPRYPSLWVQVMAMNELFPGFRFSQVGRVWTGQLQPTRESPKYMVRIEYAANDWPKVWVLQPEICEGAPHRFADHSLCLFYFDGTFTRASLIAKTIVPWTSEWLGFYEYWLATGKWLGPEAPHTPKKGVPSRL